MMTNCFYNQLPNKLSKEEQDALLTEYYKTNNEQIREKLILHNIKLILYLVNKYFKNIPIEYNDLVSIGTVGLIRSIDNFDIKKNVSFSTFAAKCIITEIKSFLIK